MNRCEDFPCCGHYDSEGTFCPPAWDWKWAGADDGADDFPDEGPRDIYGDGIYDSEEAYLNSH